MARQSSSTTRVTRKQAQSAKKTEEALVAEVKAEEQDYLTLNTTEDNDNTSSELDEALEDAISSNDEADSSDDSNDEEDVSEDEGDSDLDETEDAFVKNTSIVALDPAQQEVVQARLQQAKTKVINE
jgi:hypothetical protein